MMKKKRMLLTLTALAAACAMLLCAASCSEEKEETSSVPEINRAEDGTYFDNGELFCRGVWAADDGETRQGYYIFYDAKSGRYDEAEYGMGVPFAVSVKENTADFSLGAADFTDPVTVEKTGEGKRTVIWTNENRVEYLTLLGAYEPEDFSFYSVKTLDEIAVGYFTEKNGKTPEKYTIGIDTDGVATVTFTKGSGKKAKLLAEYKIDSITGKGTDTVSGEEIQLSEQKTEN